MAVATAFSVSQNFSSALDELLLEICEELQISPVRYRQAVERYEVIGQLLGSLGSPFRLYRPRIYPQGSMKLGTTVKPITGPHDLDFVCELSVGHEQVNPMGLLQGLYDFLRSNQTYRSMTKLMNRCVRIEYANEFYMDVLPACKNGYRGGTCIKIPDRQAQGWKDSDPLGYAEWFESRCRTLFVEQLLEKAAPVPVQQPAEEKKTLQLVVQLIKRRRDLFFKGSDLATASVVLTTLAAEEYKGHRSTTEALSSILAGIAGRASAALNMGTHIQLCNPVNKDEDLGERWDQDSRLFPAFVNFVTDFHQRWARIVGQGRNVNVELEYLFGEPVQTVLKRQAGRLQESRSAGRLGITSAGLITSGTSTAVSVRPNTFHGSR